MSGLVKRSVTLAGHRTSVALEAEFWAALANVAASRGIAPAALIAEIDAARAPDKPLASALRVFVVQSLKGGEKWSE